MTLITHENERNKRHLRSCVFDGFPGNYKAEKIEAPVLESAQMFISFIEREGSSNERNFGSIFVQETLGLMGGAADGHLGRS